MDEATSLVLAGRAAAWYAGDRSIPGISAVDGLVVATVTSGKAMRSVVPPALPAFASYAPPTIISIAFHSRQMPSMAMERSVYSREDLAASNATSMLTPLAIMYPGGGERLMIRGSGFGTDSTAPPVRILVGAFECDQLDTIRYNDSVVECASLPPGGGEDLRLIVDVAGASSREGPRATVRYTPPVVDVVFPPTGLPQHGGAEFLIVGAGFGFVDGLRIDVFLGPY